MKEGAATDLVHHFNSHASELNLNECWTSEEEEEEEESRSRVVRETGGEGADNDRHDRLSN